jgi:putative protease
MSSPKSIELLSPAKNSDYGIAAINHGADAVYIGYSSFGARKAAGNSLTDIESLIRYAHIFHSRVYITLNTILFDNELVEVEKLIWQFYQMGADAIIIQDMGILEMNLPPIAIHASTQANNTTVDKIKFLEEVGFTRVILARELSIKQILDIRNSSRIELEAFIHGALCVCYSGQCYFSQVLTGRSANRGECAQPCRSQYDLVDNSGKILAKSKHLLSLKDLNQSENIEALINAGVGSLKIEGRLKDISYVKNITAHYRQIIDRIIEQKKEYKKTSSGKCTYSFIPDPTRTFNREYTTYFANGRPNQMASFNTQKSLGKPIGMVSKSFGSYFTAETSEKINNNDGLCFFDKKNTLVGIKVNKTEGNKVYPNEPLDIARGTTIYRNYDHLFTKILNSDNSSVRQIDCSIKILFNNNSITFELIDEDSQTTTVTINHNLDPAKNKEGIINTFRSQFEKTGSSPFKVLSVEFTFISNELPFAPLAQINLWRKQLIENHSSARLNRDNCPGNKIVPNSTPLLLNNLSFKENISNRLAKQFYNRHGVSQFEDAFELQCDNGGKEVMVTRYCILFEMGYCNGAKTELKISRDLYLQDRTQRYPIVFNCQKCEMKIFYPKNLGSL